MLKVKKFIAGLGCGLLLSVATLAYASGEPLEVYLFKAKYLFNGVEAKLGDEYTTLNYNGHAYVPIRFIAEQSGLSVGYDEGSQTIKVDFDKKNQDIFIDKRVPQISISNVKAIKDPNSNTTTVTGQLSIEDMDTANVKANLSFYSANDEKLGEVIIDGDFKRGTQEFTVNGTGDFSSYSKAVFNIGALNYHVLK